MEISLPTEFHPNQTKIGLMGAPGSSLIEAKVSSLLYNKFPLQILVISFSFWVELTNFDEIFGFGMQDSFTRHIDKRTCDQSPPGKAAVTLESQKLCVLFLKVGRFCENGATFWQSIYSLILSLKNEFESP